MLNILVNDVELDFEPENEKTVGEVLGEVEKFCNTNGHSVFKVFSNDIEIAPENLDALFTESIKEDLTLKLFTRSADEILESINTIGEVMTEQAESLKEVPVKLQTDNDLFVFKLIGEISQNLRDLFKLLELFRISKISLETKVGENTIFETQKEISGFLTEITKALEEKDVITVSDLSEYELSPILSDFGNKLSKL